MKNTSVPAAPAVLSSYEQSALDFLAKHGIAFRATLAKTQKAPGWDGPHGLHYRITLSSGKPNARRLSFGFWNSINAKEQGRSPTAYDVLACISGDVHCAETFEGFCADFGHDEDSRAAHAMFKRCSTFARRLRAFFSEAEIEGLSEIQ